MENKIRHLEMIQGIINRLAGNSFLLKGWSVTLVAALFALSAKDSDFRYIFIPYFPVIIFWILDGYFLWQERLFRALFDNVRVLENDRIDFSMETKPFIGGERTWVNSIISKTLLPFYLTLVITILIIKCFLR